MFYLSWRQLIARKKQTILILLGISFGTLLFVSISGVQLGMREYITTQLLNNTAHILISGAEKDILPQDVTESIYGPHAKTLWRVPPGGKREEAKLQNYQAWYDLLQKDAAVYDFSPRLRANALASLGKFSVTIGAVGVLPERHVRLSQIDKYIKAGNFSTLKIGGNNIVVASGVAQRLGAKLNQIINVSSGTEQTHPFKIVGIVHFGNHQLDNSIAFTHLKSLQTLTKKPGVVNEIAVALFDIDRSSEIASYWKSRSKDKVEDWQEANKSFMEVIRVQDFTRYFITMAILIVAAFGIYNVLTIMINQKRKEIAILRAIGYSPTKILQLILYQGLVLGFSGGILGLVLGWLMCLWFGSIDFGFEIGDSNHLIISYDPSIYLIAFITANISAIVASYIPAWEASRMTPMDIIRSES